MKTIVNRLNAMKTRFSAEARSYFTRRLAPAIALATISIDNAYAQSFGGSAGQAICSFKNSPMPAIIVAVAIIGVAVMLILNEGKGLGSWTVRIIIGAAIIAGLGSIVAIVVPNGSLGC